jgi:hypothetical protein
VPRLGFGTLRKILNWWGLQRFGAEGGTRTPTSCLTRPSNVRVCQFRHFGSRLSDNNGTQTVGLRIDQGNNYFGELAGEAACDAAGEDAGAVEVAGDAAGAVEATGDAAGTGVASGAVDCKTEREPVTPGSDNVSAINMKAAAAPIVTFDKILAVPRGPKAELETLLEKRSPAPDLPG